MPRSKTKETVEEVKLKLWQAGLVKGWNAVGLNCLYHRHPETGEQVRLNFRDNKVLKLEVKKPLTEEEKQKAPDKHSKWEILEKGDYTKVEIGEGGEFIFPAKEKKAGPKKDEPAEGKESD